MMVGHKNFLKKTRHRLSLLGLFVIATTLIGSKTLWEKMRQQCREEPYLGATRNSRLISASGTICHENVSPTPTLTLTSDDASSKKDKANASSSSQGRSPVINDFFYSYPINQENACRQRSVKIAMPVHSAVTNFKRRQAFRQTEQHRFAARKENEALLLFFVGLPSKTLANASHFQRLLEHESRQHRDIVQMNSTDTYRNMTRKAVGVLNWILTYCPNSIIVLKLDDDTDIAQPQSLLFPIFAKWMSFAEFIIGDAKYREAPTRKRTARNYVSPEEYPGILYPPLVLGYAYGYTTATARLLYAQALRTKPLWLDDAFLKGCAGRPWPFPYSRTTASA